MPEEYFREVRYPDRRELWLDRAAEQHRMIVCRCKTCKRVVRYLAADLLLILGPAHRAMVDPPYPCRCGETRYIKVECVIPDSGDYGSLEVRRPAGVRQTQLWRTVKLGDEVENKVLGLRSPRDAMARLRPVRQAAPVPAQDDSKG